jgi:hypothetical protein
VDELKRSGGVRMVLALAGNKLDLAEQRQVPQEKALAYAEENGIFFIETSAKTSQNVRRPLSRSLDCACHCPSRSCAAAAAACGARREQQHASTADGGGMHGVVELRRARMPTDDSSHILPPSLRTRFRSSSTTSRTSCRVGGNRSAGASTSRRGRSRRNPAARVCG